jgi:hypothetical protein
MRKILILGLCLTVSPTLAATGDSGPPIDVSMGVGVATAFVPLVIGASLLAASSASDVRTAGFWVAETGLVAAPLVSHLIGREWKRALVFTAFPLASALAVSGVFGYEPGVIGVNGTPSLQIVVGLLGTATLLSSAVGLIDSLFAGERARRLRLTILPTVGRSQAGIVIGATL